MLTTEMVDASRGRGGGFEETGRTSLHGNVLEDKFTG